MLNVPMTSNQDEPDDELSFGRFEQKAAVPKRPAAPASAPAPTQDDDLLTFGALDPQRSPRQAFKSVAGIDASSAAKAERLSRETGAPVGALLGDPQALDRTMKEREFDDDDLRSRAAKTAAWLSEPINAAVAQNDVKKLVALEGHYYDAFEREAARVDLENRAAGKSGFGGLIRSMGTRVALGGAYLTQLPKKLGVVGLELVGAKGAAEEVYRSASPGGISLQVYDALEAKARSSFVRETESALVIDPITGEEKINWGAVNPLSFHGLENILGFVADESVPTAVMLAAGALTGGAGAAPIAATRAGTLGKAFKVGSAILRYAKSPVSAINAGRVIAGAYDDGVQTLMSRGMSQEEAMSAAAPGAALAGLFSVAAGGPMEAEIIEQAARRMLRTKTGYTLGARLLAFAKAGATTGAKEGLQEVAEGLGEDLAAYLTYDPDKTMKQVASNMLMNFVGGFAVGGGMGAATETGSTIRNAKARQFVEALADSHKAVEFAKVAPEKLGDYVQKLTQGGPVENLFMGAEDWVRYFQAEGLDPKAEAEKLGITPEDFDMAVERGADLVLPTGKVAETLAATDHFQKLLPNLKPEQGGLTFGEEQRAEQARLSEEEIRKLMQTTPVHPEEAEIASRVEAQLTEAKAYNGNRTAIEETARFHARVMVALATRAKMTPLQLYQREELNIRRSVEGLSRQQAAAVRLSPAGREAMSLVRTRLEASRQGQTPTQDGPVPATDPALAAPKAPGQAQGSPEAQNPVVEASSEQIQTPESELADRLLEAFERAGIDPSLGTEEEAIAALENWLQDQVRLEQAYSTRLPTAKKTPEDPHTNLLLSGIEAMKLDPVKYAENVRIVSHHPGINMPSGLSVDEQAEFWLTHVETNMLYLFDNTPQRIRDRAKLWYVGANRIANQWAEEFGLSTHQVAVVMAALSPQKDWFQNVHLARVVLEVMRDQQDFQWSPEMEKTAQATPAIKKDRATAKIRGKKLGELQTDLERAVWIRTFNETYSDRRYRAVTPEGGFGDIVTTAKGVPVKAAWGSFSEIAKAVTATRIADHKVLSTLLGEAHKVRNFYNNIFDPDSEKFVTIDTHAGAAGLFLPLSGNNREVAQIFGSSVAKKHWSYDPEAANPPSSGVYGTSGTYGLFQEAYNRAAAKRGVLPREMQSITWEAIRAIFTDSDKTQAHYERAVSVWLRYENNEITHKQAMDEIVQAFRGTTIDKAIVPSWAAEDVPSAEGEAARWGDGQARLTVESLPSTKVLEEVIPELINATPEQRKAYHAAKMQIISEALAEAGLPVASPTTGFGYWEGAVNLSTGILLNTNDPAVVRRAAQVAWWATRDQDGIGYQVPVNVDAELDRANGLMVELPEDITEEQAIALGTALAKAVPESYPDLTNLRMIRIINWGLTPGESGLEAFQQFHTAATEVISSVMPDLTGNPQVFETITDLYEGDPTNATRTSSANEGGTPDADASIADRAWTRVQQLNQRTREELQRERLYQAGPAPSFQARAGGANPVSVQGVHYSAAEGLTTLDPSFFGKGSAGAERRRLAALEPGDPRLLRTNFYVSKDGQLPRREMTVRGQNVYEAELTNLYDMAADPEGLRANAGGDANAFEQAVIDAGYDGYMSPAPGVNGSVVLLGVGPVPVRSLGTATTEQASGKAPITLEELRALRGEEEGEVGGTIRVMQSAFHGSPYRFDQFTLDAIGSGEGNQAYGWGLYFAGDKEVADWYRRSLAGSRIFYGPDELEYGSPEYVAANMLLQRGLSVQRAQQDLISYTSGLDDPDAEASLRFLETVDPSKVVKSGLAGQLYKVEIPEDEQLLNQETPISEQSKQVQDALKAIVYSLSDTNLEDLGLSSHAKAWREFRSMPSAGLVYTTLSSLLGGDKAVSLKLNEHGVPGMRYLDGNSRSGADGNYNYIIFDDSAVQVLETFYQNARGYLEFAPAQRGAERRRFDMTLLKGADRSTVFHELGHFYMEVLGDLAALPDADASLKADYQTIRSWLGAEGSAPLTKEQHEQFADGWLVYLLEGKAPIPDLVRPFQKFSRWLKKVGAALTGTKIELTDEVRGVFDRLVATEEALDLAKQELGLDLFTSAEAMGMTQAEFDAYKKKLTRLIQGARDKVTRKVFDAYKEQQGEAWKQELDERADEILQELAKRPSYQATAQMLSGRLLDGTEVEVRLSKMWLTEKYGKDAVASIDPDLLATEGGVDADAAALLLGFSSGDALVNALSGLEPAEEVAYRMAEEAMRLTHGDPMSDPNAMMKASLDALTSNELSDMLSVELKALINKSEALRMGRESYVQMLSGLKAAAREHVAKQPVFKIQPFEFLRAQRKAGNEALRFAKAGNMEKAADAKKRELLNQYLHKEAVEAQERAEKFRRFVKQSDKASTRLKMGKAGGDHLAQFDALRDRFGIERLPNKEVERRFTLEKWVEQQVLEGNDTAIDPALLDESKARNYRQLTVEELDALHAALRNIKHLAYKDLYAVIDNKRIERAAMIEELVVAIRASSPQRRIPLGGSPERDTAKFKAAASLMGFDATMVKIEQMINWIDNDDVNGPAHRYIWNRIAKAQTAEYDMQIRVTKQMTSMLESMPKEFRESWDDVLQVDGFPEPLKRSQIITMLLYMGQEERHRKLVGGLLTVGITEAAINRAVQRLNASDVKFVNDVWSSFDTIWTDIAALEKRLTGVEPTRQDNQPFTLRGEDGNVIGHLTGGYFPLVADPEHTGELAKKQEGGTVQQVLASNGYARAATSTGHVKELTGKVYPLLLNFQHTMTSHLSNVIKDLTHREVVLDVNRILHNGEFQKAMREHYGPAYEAQLNPWLVNIVKDHNTGAANGLGAWNNLMTKLRGNTVAAMLGFKFGTVIIQTTDLMRLFAPGEYRLKPLQFLKAMWSFLAHPVRTANAVYELSGEMRHRAENLDRDLRARFDQLRGDESLLAQWNRAGFKALGWMDKLVSMPAWLAAYNQGVKAHGDVDRAVLEADRVVRLRLMTGAPKDIAAIQRQDGMMKLITMFMGDASANYGMLRNAGHRVDGFKGIPALTTTALMVAMSQVLGDLIKGMGPDDDDEMKEWLVMKTLTAPLSTIPLVRDVANLFENYVEGRPIQNYRFTPVTQGVVKPLLAVPATVKWVEGDITWDEWGATSIESIGYAFGVAGTSQFATSAKYLRSVKEGEENPENAAEFALGVLRGKGGRR